MVKIPTMVEPLPVHSKKTIITDALNPRPKILPVVRMTNRIILLVRWMRMKIFLVHTQAPLDV
jgi:hypothetical protein